MGKFSSRLSRSRQPSQPILASHSRFLRINTPAWIDCMPGRNFFDKISLGRGGLSFEMDENVRSGSFRNSEFNAWRPRWAWLKLFVTLKDTEKTKNINYFSLFLFLRMRPLTAQNLAFCRNTLSETKHPKFTSPSETTSNRVWYICEFPPPSRENSFAFARGRPKWHDFASYLFSLQKYDNY